ncbi:MAG: hypothetical protein ACW99G_07970 [Candidatus Thorarchaeota archaeon]|jgi:hypothetical protein
MTETIKLAKSEFMKGTQDVTFTNPWTSAQVDKMEILDLDTFEKLVNACRFFYRYDSLVATVINKITEIGINKIEYDKASLNENEKKVMDNLVPRLMQFAEQLSMEYLISGLVVPEIKYAAVTKKELDEWKIKRYETLTLPVYMWLRDPTTIKINDALGMEEPSYFYKIPEDLVYFIKTEGKYKDGTKDEELYKEIVARYPEFVEAVRNNEKYILLENDLIFRRKVVTDSPYPTPYLTPALEPLKHKRNLRRMDYSIASRVISAIQLFRLGNDDFPVTEDQEEIFDDLKQQMYWRYSQNDDIERIFQLFANHTLEIDWVLPPVEALLDETKYREVNDDIIFGLGFPRILITGETSRSGTSNAEYATMSPVRTMDKIRDKVLYVLNDIVYNIFEKNKFRGKTKLKFAPINLVSFNELVEGLTKLYESGNLSRDSYAKAFDYDIDEELELRKQEQDKIEELGIETSAPVPFSPPPQQGGNQSQNKPKPKENQ